MQRSVVRRLDDRARVCLFALAIVPLAFGVIHTTPGGVPPAEGCSGQGSAVTSVSLLNSKAVGRDGFFPIFVNARGLDGVAVLPSLDVQVSEGQAIVPGTTALLHSRAESFIFGWSAQTPLSAGATLQASASSGSLPVSAATLVVSDVTPTLAAPTLSLGQWSRHTRDVGTALVCNNTSTGACAILFGTDVEESTRGALTGSTSPLPVLVAWEISVVAVDGKGTFTQTSPTEVVYDTRPQQIGMELHFTPGAGERCVRVVARDLRTSAVAMSEPTCSTPGTLAQTTSDRISACPAVPPGYEERWCDVNMALGRPCSGSGGAGGSGGSGIVAGSGGSGIVAGSGGSGGSQLPDAGAGGTSGEAGGSGPDNAGAGNAGDETGGTSSGSGGTSSSSGSGPAGAGAPDEGGVERTVTEGCGCRTWRSRSTQLGGLAVLTAAFGLLVRRRRRREL